MKISEYKSYDDLPLFLNAAMVAKVLGIAPSSSCELLHKADFPVLNVRPVDKVAKKAAESEMA